MGSGRGGGGGGGGATPINGVGIFGRLIGYSF